MFLVDLFPPLLVKITKEKFIGLCVGGEKLRREKIKQNSKKMLYLYYLTWPVLTNPSLL